jgi:flavin-dependent dehydrogenase
MDRRGWDEDFEVVVVGGGPGGSTTAARLAQHGRRVLVLERDRFPRFHIGESLLPSSTPVLAELGLFEELDRLFVRKYSARFLDDGAGVGGPDSEARYAFAEAFPPAVPHAWEVTRAELDDLLLRNAARLGAEIREGVRVSRVLREGSGEDDPVVGVEVETAEGVTRRIGARVVVDATGRDALLARGRRDKRRVPGLDKTAVFTQIQGGHRNAGIDEGQIEITILAGRNPDGTTPGWAWFIPFKDGRTSCGFVLSTPLVEAFMKGGRAALGDAFGEVREYDEPSTDTRDKLTALFDACLERSPWMRHFMGDAPRIEPIRAAADFSFRVDRLYGDGWLAVGDAAGFLDPLFSTGAHLAIGGGDLAARSIDAALRASDVRAVRFEKYGRDLRRAADLFLGAVQSFYRGELRALLFARDQRPALRKTITSMLAGDVFHAEDGAALWVGYFRERFPAQV